MVEELAGALCMLVIALVVITLLGHFIWVVVAWLIKAMLGNRSSDRQTPRISSPFDPASSDELAAIRHLRRLFENDILDEDDFSRLIGLVRQRPPEAPPVATSATEPVTESPFYIGDDSIVDAVIVDEPVDRHPTRTTTTNRKSVSTPAEEVVHPLDRDEPEPATRSPAIRRTLADVLQSFMAEKNIRWGELVSGMLIVGSAVGLVISLRETLNKSVPYFPALLFMLITLAIHGAGLYTLRRWNLRSTSRGVLIIALLLAPLNFLAGIIMSGPQERSFDDPTLILAIVIGTAGYGWVTYSAGRALLGRDWWRLSLAIMATSLGQIIVDRATPESPTLWQTGTLLALPLIGYLSTSITLLWSASAWPRMSLRRAERFFITLGISTFALLIPLGLFIAANDSARMAFSRLAPWISLIAAIVLTTGWMVFRRTTSKRLAALQTAGLSLTIVGSVGMLIAVVLAWPIPDVMIAVGVINAAIMLVLALVTRLPVLHVPSVICAAMTTLIGFHVARDHFAGDEQNLSRQMVQVLLMAVNGYLLVGFQLMVSAIAAAMYWLKRTSDAFFVFISGCGLAVIVLLIAVYHGFGPGSETAWATPLFAIYASVVLIAAVFARHQSVTWLGSSLLLVTLVHGFWLNESLRQWLADHNGLPARSVLVALLSHGVVSALSSTGIYLAWQRRTVGDVASRIHRTLVQPLAYAGVATATIALPAALLVVDQPIEINAGYLAAIALVWLGMFVVGRQGIAIVIFQSLFAAALCYFVAGFCQTSEQGRDWFLAPRHVQWQLGSLSLWCLAWSGARRLLQLRGWGPSIPRPITPMVDEIVLGLVVFAMVAFAAAWCWPGTMLELGITSALGGDRVSIGWGAWLAWALIVAAVCVSLWERFSLAAIIGLLAGSVAVPLLISCPFESVSATASALRWSFAVYTLVVSALVWLRTPIGNALHRIGWLQKDDFSARTTQIARELGLLIGGLPILTLTTTVVIRSIADAPLGQIAADSLFGQMSTFFLYSVPLIVLVAVLLGHAIREHNPIFAFAGSAVLQYVVTLAYLLDSDTQAPGFAAGLLQWNAVALGAYTLVWMSLGHWINDGSGLRSRNILNSADNLPLAVQLIATIAATAAISVWAAAAVALTPGVLGNHEQSLGEMISYVAWMLAAAACAFCFFRERLRFHIKLATGFAAMLIPVIALSIDIRDGGRQWDGFHALTYGWLGLAVALVALDWFLKALRWEVVAILTAVVSLAIGGSVRDPQSAWWSMIAVGVACVGFAVLAMRYRSQPFAYAATLLAVCTSVLYWIEPILVMAGPKPLFNMIESAMVTAILISGWWLACDLWYQRRHDDRFDADSKLPRVHTLTAVATTGSAAIFLGLLFLIRCIARSQGTTTFPLGNVGEILLVASLLLLSLGMLWDRYGRLALPCMYANGLLVALVIFDAYGPNVTQGLVGVDVLLAAQVMLTGLVWHRGVMWAVVGTRLGIPDAVLGLKRAGIWMPPVNLALTFLSMAIGLIIVLGDDERPLRICAGFGPVLLAIGIGALAQKQRRGVLQFTSLLMTAVAAIYLSWADIEPSWDSQTLLLRLVRTLIVLSGLAFIYGAIVVRRLSRQSDWRAIVQKVSVVFAAAAISVLAVVLVIEAVMFEPVVGVEIATVNIGAVAVVLIALTVALISLALLPERDPLALSETGRTGYVYAAELVATLLFAHLYLCRPLWFEGPFRAYWPYIVMGIAFGGASAGELFRRSGIRVLGEPLQRTSAFLPLVPALGFWVVAAKSTDFTILLFSVGLLYVVLSVLRRSLLSVVAAVVAGNLALWSMWHESGFAFLRHPQFWLIPPAASLLVAGHLNRRRLSETQLTALRYICMSVIYLSSTGEMFIRGVGTSLWPPVILTLLSVAGVFAGIILRIRAFLYMGFSFVLLSIISMVWHASRAINHVWPWWAFLIALGLAMLILFGVFEKKRPEIMRLISKLRAWDG